VRVTTNAVPDYDPRWYVNPPPVAVAITRLSPDPAPAGGAVQFQVTFSEPVTGVGPADFALALTGGASATIASVTADATGAVYTATVHGLAGSGKIDGLDLVVLR